MTSNSKHFEVTDNFVKNYDYPEISKIEFTERCQLKCPGCMNSGLGKQTDITIGVIETIIANDYLRNTGFVELMISGEALLHPMFREYAMTLKRTGVMLGVSTNLAFKNMDDVMSKLILMDAVTVSIDSFDPDTYNKMRVGSDFHILMHNIQHLDKHLPADSIIYLQLLKTDISGPWHLDSIYRLDLWIKRNLSTRVVLRYVDDCFKGWMGKEFEPSEEMCLTPFEAVCIKSNGNVIPCGYCFKSEILLGNILHESLKDIWNGHTVGQLRAAHQSQFTSMLPDHCLKCYRRSNHTFQRRIMADIIKYRNGGSIR